MTFDRAPKSGFPRNTLDSVARRALMARLDACIAAVEAAATCFARVQPVGDNADDWAKLRAVEDQFAALRTQIDDLALSALHLTDYCDHRVETLRAANSGC